MPPFRQGSLRGTMEIPQSPAATAPFRQGEANKERL